MSGEFRGVVFTAVDVPSTSGNPVGITMPSDIVAGDILVVNGGSYNLSTLATQPSGWSTIDSFTWVKIADGSEAGATLTWLSRDTTTFDPFGTSPNPRGCVFAAFCYRFPVAIVAGTGGIGPNAWFHPLLIRGSAPGGTPIRFSDQNGHTGINALVNGINYQFRWLNVTANGDSQAVATSIVWSGDLLVDRAGGPQNQPLPSDPDAFGSASWSWADQMYLSPTVNNDPHTDVLVDAAGNAGLIAAGFALLFPNVPTLAYWGINASTPT